ELSQKPNLGWTRHSTVWIGMNGVLCLQNERKRMIMKKLIISIVVGCLAIGSSSYLVRGQDKNANEKFNQRLHAVDDASKKSGNMKTTIHAISVETGVAESEVEAMHKRYSDIGAAGLLTACVLADETKK